MATPVGIAEYLKAIYNNIPLVYKAGGNAWKKAFWNSYQNKGIRTDYAEAFSGKGWTVEYFTPMYELHPTQSAENMFARSVLAIDLANNLTEQGIAFNMTHATNISGLFYDSDFTRVPKITLGGSLTSSVWHLFSESDSLVTIDEIELTDDFTDAGTVVLWAQCFENCVALKNITFTGNGKITQSIDLQWSKSLTKASITNIINYLSTDSNAMICRLSLEAVNVAFESAEGAKDGTSSAEWTALIETKPNWSVALM